MRRIRKLLPLLVVVAGATEAGDDPVGTVVDRVAGHEAEHCHDERCEGGGGESGASIPSVGARSCVDGRAGPFSCNRVDLRAFVAVAELGGGSGNDVWGWTDPATGSEYAVMGRSTGTSFVDVTIADDPVYLGELPARGGASIWRDVKIHGDHAYVVSEAPGHGLVIFDLRRLAAVESTPAVFSQSARWGGFGNAHNLFIEEETGFAYVVGSRQCDGGLLIVDLERPRAPRRAGCFADDGYTHDVYCHVYSGPDTEHLGKEICYASNEDTLTVVDVTDKTAPVMLARAGYDGASYTHQAWITGNHRWLLVGDELDEFELGVGTTTYVFSLLDLDAPRLRTVHEAPTAAIDHNQYVVGKWTFQANYTAGLRILALDQVGQGRVCEIGHFDVFPADDHPTFDGAWSVYPFFDSGTVLVSSFEGLAVLRPRLGGLGCAQVCAGGACG
ncbi:MAG: choice-of-anchor B family protein [Thermoanaerobaculia bacterium]|nr:choice-of-anchor B family protein [Thermoanaerobaculia bacterium]